MLGGAESARLSRSAEDELLDSVTSAEVRDAIESLPEGYRVAVLLADVEGFAYKEIAEILDVPIGTVMSRLHRGRKRLREALQTYGEARGLVADDSALRRAPEATDERNSRPPTLRPSPGARTPGACRSPAADHAGTEGIPEPGASHVRSALENWPRASHLRHELNVQVPRWRCTAGSRPERCASHPRPPTHRLSNIDHRPLDVRWPSWRLSGTGDRTLRVALQVPAIHRTEFAGYFKCARSALPPRARTGVE